jgi:Asp-tRNA(Asn)/Glu-tRNA(Gln) amidotransferase A subunit family amidase
VARGSNRFTIRSYRTVLLFSRASSLGRRDRGARAVLERASGRPVDALVYPFKSLGAPAIGEGDRGSRDNPLSAVTGLPAIVVPAGVTREGFPLSLEMMGRPFSEPTLIRIAHAYEQATHNRVAPSTTPHLPGETFSY